MNISKTTMVLVLGMEAFFCACSDEAVDMDAVQNDHKWVAYNDGTWIHQDGKRYDLHVEGDYLLMEEVE